LGVISPERSGQAPAPIAQPEPGLTADTLIERAAAMRPMLLQQQDEGDWRGCYSDEIHQAFEKAGFYRIMQPRAVGGYQLPPAVFLKVVMEISRGHPGAGWCFTLAGSHAYLVASHWPAEAQAELFAPDGQFRAAHVVGPYGTMTRTEGGYIADGVYPFCSGIPVSTHFIGGGLAPQSDGEMKHVFFVVPRSECEILPDWGEERFMGMQASGSNSVRLTQVFVPDRMITPALMMTSSEPYPDGTPGTRLYGDPMYLAVLMGWFHCEFGAIMTGAARAALDEFEELARSKPMFTDPGLKRVEDPFTQNLFATALGKADSAEALTLAAIELLAEQQRRWAETGAPITPKDSLRIWGMAREACRMANEATESLFHAVGATGGRRGNRLQRYFRDIEMYRLHIQSQPTLPTMRGRIEFGLPTVLLGGQKTGG
jgi:3-hydroxy-9,10-secoandrosta-1,3,5(10)-triene-9,17-dione monooxygenase